MSDGDAKKKIEEDIKELFAVRNIDEAENYFTVLPGKFHAQLISRVIMRAIESKEADARLVAGLLERGRSKSLCLPAALEEGFIPTAEMLDDIVIDAPKAFDLMAIMMKGAKLDEEQQSRIAGKSMDNLNVKLLKLLSYILM